MAGESDATLNVIVVPPPEGSLNNFKLIPLGKPDTKSVEVEIQGLAGNNPLANDNAIGLFRGIGPSFAATPVKVFTITKKRVPARMILNYEFQPEDYSLTYQVSGAKLTNGSHDLTTICATAVLYEFPERASAANEPITNVSLEILEATSSSLKIKYEVIPNSWPATHHNWIGLWVGTPNANAPLRDPDHFASIMSDANVNILNMTKLDLNTDLPYTLIYFMAAKSDGFATGDTKAGAVLYFNLTEG